MEIEGKDLPKKRILLFLLMYIRTVFVIFFGTEQRRELSRLLLLLLDLYVVYDLVVVVAKKGKGERDSRVFSAGVRVDREISFAHVGAMAGKGNGNCSPVSFSLRSEGGEGK